MSADTLERIVPDQIEQQDATAQLSLQLHVDRYHFACNNIIHGPVLDIACGMGYGTYMLAESSDSICTGVDVSAEAIAYAATRYKHERTLFVCADLLSFDDANGFQNIVSLETIEHIQEPSKVVAHLCKLLLPGGLLIISAPVTPAMDANPYHVNDFTSNSFRDLFKAHGLTEIDSMEQVQPYSLLEVLNRKTARTSEVRRGLVKYYLQNPDKLFLRVRSLITDGFKNRYLLLVLRKQA